MKFTSLFRRPATLLALVLGVASSLPYAHATDYIWDAASASDWSTPASWNLDSGFPNSASDNVTGNTSTQTATVTGSITTGTLTPTTAGWNITTANAGSSLNLTALSTARSINIYGPGALNLGTVNLNASSGTSVVFNLIHGNLNAQIGSVTLQALNINANANTVMRVGNTTGNANLGLVTFSGGNFNRILSLNYTAQLVGNYSEEVTVSGLVTAPSTIGPSTIQGGAARTGNANTTTLDISVANGNSYSSNVILTNGTLSTLAAKKSGLGTQTLTGASDYTGGTLISAGTLLVNNASGSGLGSGNVTVDAAGTLGGTGSISGVTIVSGAIAPGASGIESLDITNDVTWNAGTAWKFELGLSNSADLLNITGVGSDFLKGTGSGWAFNFQNTGVSGGVYKLVDWEGTTTFSATDFSYTNLASGLTGTFAFNGTQLEFTVVPEPSTWMLLGMGLTAVLTLRKRRVS